MNVINILSYLPDRYLKLYIDNAASGYPRNKNLWLTLIAMQLFDPKEFVEVMEKLKGARSV